MNASSTRIPCGNLATLSNDRVVVGRPHPAPPIECPLSISLDNSLINKVLMLSLDDTQAVAGGLLSSRRLSQRSTERS
jgi:hypothetical protein